MIRRISEALCDEDGHLKTNFQARRVTVYRWYESSSPLQRLRKAAMDKLIKPYDKEYMRMAMLKHEETFKEQVHELHRLYQIQKILMKNMENSRSIELGQRGWSFKNAINMTQTSHRNSAQPKPQIKFDLELPADENKAESDGDEVLEIIDETKIELTLGPSSYIRRKKVETPLTSDSGHSFSSSSTGSSHINKTSSKNQRSSDIKREESSGGIIGLVQVPDSTSGYQSEIRNNFDIEEQSRQERLKQPPWLFKVLSLNMT
ncbi:hypothetical protein L6164_019841 [Bauhinia variegata]|uniref:Uncharacterized protein n=1 Tax=Bauhinia variegata TaxID=167791 RepID=A0ACB9MT74_BAUVA|nr:hypothetical protein L6164_019841 [Bauhinia variegata]